MLPAPWWLPGGDLQTVWPLLIRPVEPALRRERWETPDGDFIDVDWLAGHEAPDAVSAPCLLLFHGLEGCSRSHYARALYHAVSLAGWRMAVAHFRGCSGMPNLRLRAYHSGDHAEVGWIVQRMAQRALPAGLFVAGVSLGGSALLNWLARADPQALAPVRAACAICPPLDLTVCGHAIDSRAGGRYARHFLETLKPKALLKARRYPSALDADAICRADSLHAFDNAYTAPVHGFINTDDYWTRASSRPHLAQITTPTLLLMARNDPFVPAASQVSQHECSDAMTLRITPQGGHVGFVDGRFPGHLGRLPEHVLSFFGRFTDRAP